jgi:hypothetical protein
MKTFTYFILGVLIGALLLWLVMPHVGRYTMTRLGNSMLRTDTATGRTWLFEGSWVKIKEGALKPAQTAAEFLDAPATFVPDATNSPALPHFGQAPAAGKTDEFGGVQVK